MRAGGSDSNNSGGSNNNGGVLYGIDAADSDELISSRDQYCQITSDHTLCQFHVSVKIIILRFIKIEIMRFYKSI